MLLLAEHSRIVFWVKYAYRKGSHSCWYVILCVFNDLCLCSTIYVCMDCISNELVNVNSGCSCSSIRNNCDDTTIIYNVPATSVQAHVWQSSVVF